MKQGKFSKSYTPSKSVSLLEELIMCIANLSLRAVSGHFFLVFYHWAWQSGRFINFFPSAVISLSLVKTCLWLLWQTSHCPLILIPPCTQALCIHFTTPWHKSLLKTEWGRSNVLSPGFKRPRAFPLAPLCFRQTLGRPGQVRSWQECKKAVAESGHCQATPTLPHSSVGTSRAVQPALKGRQSNAYCADFWMQLNLGWFIMQQEITDIILWIVMDEASFTLTALGSFDY